MVRNKYLSLFANPWSTSSQKLPANFFKDYEDLVLLKIKWLVLESLYSGDNWIVVFINPRSK